MNPRHFGQSWLHRWQYFTVLALGALPFSNLAYEPVNGRPPQAPPTPPPVIKSGPIIQSDGPVPGPLMLWSIGQPTDEEQLYLEYINRSRANPPAEGARLASTTDPDVLSAYSYFNVDLNLMQSQFNAIPAVQPLAMSQELMQAARLHSGDMFTNQFQGHNGINGSTLGQRVAAEGYNYSSLAENVFSYSESVWYGHAGFNVDWGTGTGGMQNPPGHRNNIHNGTMREVGVGVVDGINGTVGPQLVTQDFGVRQGAVPFVTGVVYYDLNGNNFYDPGEGIGGVNVNVDGSAYYTVTADSGGYAVPVTTNGSYKVTFTAPGLNRQTLAGIANAQNVKLDFVPVYQAPTISGPNPASLNQSNVYTISTVGSAIAYDWMAAMLANYTAVEGAESLANVTIVSSAGYSVQATAPKFAGNYSFHLAQPQDPASPTDQFIYLNTIFRPQATTVLSFYKQLSWATANQVARAQVSTNGGASWIAVWNQAGNGSAGDSSFSQVTVSLAPFAGLQTQLRFVYDYTGGNYFPQTDQGTGFYLDNIAVSNASYLVGAATNSIASGSSFSFSPSVLTNYLLSARAYLSGRVLSWGPALQVSTSTAPPAVLLGSKPFIAAGQIQLDFTVANYSSGMTLQLYKAPSPQGPWTLDSTATLQATSPNGAFRFSTGIGSSTGSFYRVRVTF